MSVQLVTGLVTKIVTQLVTKTSDLIDCHNVEEIKTIALVQKSASNGPYLARNKAVNSDWTSGWTSDWTSD